MNSRSAASPVAPAPSRQFRRLVSGFVLAGLAACGGGGGGAPSGSGGTPVAPPTPYDDLAAVFDAPASPHFGIATGRIPRDGGRTHYAVPTPTGDNSDDLAQVWFEVGNRDLIVHLDADGRMEYPVVYGPRAGFVQGTDGTPTHGPRDFLTGSPWSLVVARTGGVPMPLHTLAAPTVDLLGGDFFRWSYDLGDLRVEFIPVAPERGTDAGAQPRALLCLVRVTNVGVAHVAGTLDVGPLLPDVDAPSGAVRLATSYGPVVGTVPWNHGTDRRNYVPRFAEVGPALPGYEAAAAVGGSSFAPGTSQVPFSLEAGAASIVTVALLVGGGAEEIAHTRDAVRGSSPLAWVNETSRAKRRRRGWLEIPSDPWTAEWIGRAIEIGMDAYLRDGEGRLSSPHGGSWMLAARVQPRLLADVLPGGDLGYACPTGDVTWSLTGVTLPAVMAGLHYRATGDRSLADGAACRAQVPCLVEALQAQRVAGTRLLRSVRIWDGPSRGDFHTGSNVAAWFALKTAARFAGDVWGDAARAATWSADADAVREDLLARCVVPGRFGPQFSEGSFVDGRVDGDVLCHDGEEIVVACAPQLGFVDVDDVRCTNHGAAAMTAQNRYWNSAVHGMHWNESAPVTSPGWLVALSGAAGEAQLRDALDLWRRVTDVDGSVWWWPYDFGETQPSSILRRASHVGGGILDTAKCDYASSNAVAILLHGVLGLDADVPARTASFRPLPPWRSFRWTDGRSGDAFFDVAYTENGATVTATVTNRNPSSYRVLVELTVPTGRRALAGQANSRRFGRDARRVEVDLDPGATTSLVLDHEAVPGSPCAAAAFSAAAAAHESLRAGGWSDAAGIDSDGDGVLDGHAWRLLAEARCSDPAVEAAYQANRVLGAGLGWGDAWATICAEYATVSQAQADVVNQWCSPRLPFVPFRRGVEEPLAGRGDFDGDGRSNEAEYLAVGGPDASPELYAQASSRP